MSGVRLGAYALLAALATACASPSPQERIDGAEIASLASLRNRYSNVVMGFDIHPQTTLVVGLDLQHYLDMDDDAVAAMQRDVLARWRSAWRSEHPHAHALLHVRFIDFIGRKVAVESTNA